MLAVSARVATVMAHARYPSRAWNGGCDRLKSMKPRPLRTTAFIAFCIASGACVSAKAPAPPAVSPGSESASRQPGRTPPISDHFVVAVVLHELSGDTVLSHESMGISSVGGVVTLTGTVSTRLAHDRAVERVRLVRGVRAIVDRLEIAPIPRPDYEIDFAVAGALSHDPVVIGQRIAAQSRAAVVRLMGEVDSNATRRAAEADVLGVPGVVDVVDDLAIFPGHRTDARIGDEETRVLADDPWIDTSGLRLQVSHGVIRLTGHVRTGAERARAEGDAHAVSPEGVDVHSITITGGYDDGTLRGGEVPAYSDEDIALALREAFARDPRVHSFVPSIDVKDGAVALSGHAPSKIAALAASDDARNVLGVTRVRNAVETDPETSRPDGGVTSLQPH
jgi:osmotically-inducible protein OsmY